MENPDIYDLRFTIYYFSVASVLSVAQTTVLIGVNPCLTESDLKKQSQFLGGQNDVKSILIMVYENLDGWMQQKNKANQSQFGYFTAENAGCAEVFDVYVKTHVGVTGYM